MITLDARKQILAIDPARQCGWMHSDGSGGSFDLGPGDERLPTLYRFIMDTAQRKGVKKLAAENATFGGINRKIMAQQNEMRGILKLAASLLGVELVLYGPTTIKAFFANSGGADKRQMMAAFRTYFGREPTDDNEADAGAVLLAADQGYIPPPSAKKKKRASDKELIRQINMFKRRK